MHNPWLRGHWVALSSGKGGSAGTARGYSVITATVGLYPQLLAFDAAHAAAIVPNNGDNTVSIVSRQGATVATLSRGFDAPFDVAIDALHRRALITNLGPSNTLSIIQTDSPSDTSTVTFTAPSFNIPAGITLDPLRRKAWLTNLNDNVVSVLDLSRAITPTVRVVSDPTGSFNVPEDLVADPRRGRVYVVNNGNNTLSVVDARHDSVTGVISSTLFNQPVGIAVDEGLDRLYVANTGNNTVAVVLAASSSHPRVVLARDPRGTFNVPFIIAVAQQTHRVFVANNAGNTISVLGAALTVYGTITDPSLNGPEGLAIDDQGRRLYVSNDNADTVSIVMRRSM
jgi:YVTN family beta-propeller protein